MSKSSSDVQLKWDGNYCHYVSQSLPEGKNARSSQGEAAWLGRLVIRHPSGRVLSLAAPAPESSTLYVQNKR